MRDETPFAAVVRMHRLLLLVGVLTVWLPGMVSADATFSPNYTSIGYPSYVKHGQFRDTSFIVTNTGNQDLTFTISTYVTSGPAGWLTVNGFGGLVQWGANNSDTGNLRLNSGGNVNSPGTVVVLSGGVVFGSNAASSPDTIHLTVHVADTVIYPRWDTLYVQSVSKDVNRKGLTVSNNGGFGNQGIGRVNLDFAGWNDCDSTADVYLFDGSVVVGYTSGTDTNLSTSAFQSDWLSETGLRPISGPKKTVLKNCWSDVKYNLYYSGRFTTVDSNLTMEASWISHVRNGTSTEDSAWMFQAVRIFNTSGTTLSGVTVGVIADWNIPSDTLSRNSSGFNTSKNLIFQQGGEYDDNDECQNNDARFGAIQFLKGYKNASVITTPSGAFTAQKPTGNLDRGAMYASMQQSGFFAENSMSDIYTTMVVAKEQTLAATDTIRFYLAWLTVRNGDTTALFNMSDRTNSSLWGFQSYPDDFCAIFDYFCYREGDFNYSWSVNIVDVNKYVAYLFQGGPPSTSFHAADFNDDARVNILDLTAVVAYLFQGGPTNPCP